MVYEFQRCCRCGGCGGSGGCGGYCGYCGSEENEKEEKEEKEETKEEKEEKEETKETKETKEKKETKEQEEQEETEETEENAARRERNLSLSKRRSLENVSDDAMFYKKIRASSVALLYLIYPSITSGTFTLFSCRQVCSGEYLREDLSEQCWVGRHASFAYLLGRSF